MGAMGGFAAVPDDAGQLRFGASARAARAAVRVPRSRMVGHAPIRVLKLGSSILACPDDYLTAAKAIRAEAARGSRVVAVVSAMGGTTDSLLSAARSVTRTPPDALMGALLATGEEASVALMVLALTSSGVPAVGLNAWRLPLRTRGDLNDAEPVAVDTGPIRAALGAGKVVVFPGFIGMDVTGVPSVLGRGGSDLTALFLGDALGAAEVRLVKDVDGVFESDPRRCADHRAYDTLTWKQARRVGGGVVQPKAIDFAERRGLRFRVTGLGGRGTTVGASRVRLAAG